MRGSVASVTPLGPGNRFMRAGGCTGTYIAVSIILDIIGNLIRIWPPAASSHLAPRALQAAISRLVQAMFFDRAAAGPGMKQVRLSPIYLLLHSFVASSYIGFRKLRWEPIKSSSVSYSMINFLSI